ncbi:MAG: PP2C family protein-serine/threonine phosphatase [Planctomycetota bacterium]|jgi:hypothetical protein
MSPDTSQVLFRHEYEHELETWVRRRFTFLCVTYGVLGAINLLLGAPALLGAFGPGAAGVSPSLITTGEGAVWLVIVGFFFHRRSGHESRADVLSAATRMILALGAVSLISRFVAEWMGLVLTGSVVFAVFFWHFTACLFLPWTPRDSLRPILPLLVIWAVYTLLSPTGAGLVPRILSVMLSPGILIPGLLICGWRLKRHSQRFRSTMLGEHFRTLRQELTRARTIHESLFPSEYEDGFVRFQYTYRPMRQLGGDFLHLHVGPEGLLHLTLLDVTGHGLAAALTVNRIYGELERVRAESPRAGPGELLGQLNRYLCLTMVKHNIYATAIALRLDPYLGQIEWASAGHPPAFLRGANGVVRHLPATTMVLGAVVDEDFEAQEQRLELSPGDVIVAYTDGTFEARNRSGRQYGLDSLRELLHVKPPPPDWPRFICSSVDRHQVGRVEDDVLVAALTFSAARPEPRPAQTALATS